MTYYVYEHWTAEDKARVHLADCSHCNHGSGVHPDASNRNGRWLGPFNTFHEALRAAQRTGRTISFCQKCNPDFMVEEGNSHKEIMNSGSDIQKGNVYTPTKEGTKGVTNEANQEWKTKEAWIKDKRKMTDHCISLVRLGKYSLEVVINAIPDDVPYLIRRHAIREMIIWHTERLESSRRHAKDLMEQNSALKREIATLKGELEIERELRKVVEHDLLNFKISYKPRFSDSNGKTLYDIALETAQFHVLLGGVNEFTAAELYREACQAYPDLNLKRSSFSAHVIASAPKHPSWHHFHSCRDYFEYMGDGKYSLNPEKREIDFGVEFKPF